MTEESIARARREHLRWFVLYVLERCTLDVGANEASLRYMISGAEGMTDLHKGELRKELLYLNARQLITLDHGDHVVHWHAKLTREGTDVAQYTVPCEPGIARPRKEW
jgi:hypothetical protein